VSLPEPPTPLPAPSTSLPEPLTDALWRRRSHYAFADRPLSISALSTLLRLAVGVSRTVPAYGVDDHPLSLAPSAGGLRSLTTYVIVSRDGEQARGVYAYDPVGHTLVQGSDADPREALASTYVQPEFATRAPVSLAFAAHLDVALAKYPPRHFRTLHVDAGIAAQNLYLVSTALDLACCAVSGFHDDKLAALLRLPPASIPMLLFPVGHLP
jgi:SagB-type dehydrogenase family enzyme